MSFRMFLIAILLVAGAVTGCRTAPGTSMGGHPVYGLLRLQQRRGALRQRVPRPSRRLSLDGKPIGVANDLQASLVDARAACTRSP